MPRNPQSFSCRQLFNRHAPDCANVYEKIAQLLYQPHLSATDTHLLHLAAVGYTGCFPSWQGTGTNGAISGNSYSACVLATMLMPAGRWFSKIPTHSGTVTKVLGSGAHPALFLRRNVHHPPPPGHLNTTQRRQQMCEKVRFVQQHFETAQEVLLNCHAVLTCPREGFIKKYRSMWKEGHDLAVEKSKGPLHRMARGSDTPNAQAAAVRALREAEDLQQGGLYVLPQHVMLTGLREMWRGLSSTGASIDGLSPFGIADSVPQECELLLLIHALLTGSDGAACLTTVSGQNPYLSPDRVLLDWMLALKNREFSAGIQHPLRAWLKVRGCPPDALDSIHDICRLVSRRDQFAPNCEKEIALSRLLVISKLIAEGERPPANFPSHPALPALLVFPADNFRRELKRRFSAITEGSWAEMNCTNMCGRFISYVTLEVFNTLKGYVMMGCDWHDPELMFKDTRLEWLEKHLTDACGGWRQATSGSPIFGGMLEDQKEQLPDNVQKFLADALGSKAVETALEGLSEVWAKQQDHGTAHPGTEKGKYAHRYCLPALAHH